MRPSLPENWVWHENPGYAFFDPDEYRERVLGVIRPKKPKKWKCKSSAPTSFCQISEKGMVCVYGEVPHEVVRVCIQDFSIPGEIIFHGTSYLT